MPVFYENHEHHLPSKRLFLAAGKSDFCARRSLGEVFATLTGLPLRPRITGAQGMAMVNEINRRLTIVSLSDSEYLYTLESVSLQAIAGNTAYDALIAHCALKSGATTLVTWNVRHFIRLGPEIANLVKTPLEL